jgi:hypothetical protein
MVHRKTSRGRFLIFLLAAFCLLPVIAQATLAPSRIRTVNIKVVADQNFTRQDAWQRKAGAMIAEASQTASELIGIRLNVLEYAEWNHPDDSDFFRLTGRLVGEVKTGRAETVICFTLLPRPAFQQGLRTDGITVPFHAMLIMTHQGTDDGNFYVPYIIVHELVHLFGGIHTHDGTLMTPAMSDTIVLDLDSINRAIVDLCHDIDFAAGYQSLDSTRLVRLVDLYELAKRQGRSEAEIDDFLVNLYPLVGRLDTGVKLLQHLIAVDSGSVINWLRLGDYYIRKGRSDSAVAITELALQKVTDKGQLNRQLAVLYYNRQEFEKARECATSAEKQGAPLDSTFWQALTKAENLPHR